MTLPERHKLTAADRQHASSQTRTLAVRLPRLWPNNAPRRWLMNDDKHCSSCHSSRRGRQRTGRPQINARSRLLREPPPGNPRTTYQRRLTRRQRRRFVAASQANHYKPVGLRPRDELGLFVCTASSVKRSPLWLHWSLVLPQNRCGTLLLSDGRVNGHTHTVTHSPTPPSSSSPTGENV